MSIISRAKAIELLSEFNAGSIIKKVEIGDFSDLITMLKYGNDGLVNETNEALSIMLENQTSIKYTVYNE